MPFAFIEYGVAMLSSVLASKRAIQFDISSTPATKKKPCASAQGFFHSIP